MKRLAASILLGGLCAVLVVLATGRSVHAGSAWPRGKGKVFVSLSWTSFGDLFGYVETLENAEIAPMPLEITEEIGTYAEFGVSDRMTVGIDRTVQGGNGIASTVIFGRLNLGRLDRPNQFAVELGAGPYRDWRGSEDTMLRLGLAWGRGLDTRFGPGWAEVDGKVANLSRTDTVLWKIDSTVGLNISDKRLAYLQLQSGALEGHPVYARLAPTYVQRFGRHFSLESALRIGLHNDDAVGVKLGLWAEF